MNWISVKDKLPDDGFDCIITDGINFAPAWYSIKSRRWRTSSDMKVTHWVKFTPPTPNADPQQ